MSSPPTSPPRPHRLREAHAHIASFGESLALLDLADCRGVADCLHRLAPLAAAARPHDPRTTRAGWVLAFGARVESWPEHRWPTRQELNEACDRTPCILMSFDHHSAAANDRALDLAGLFAGQPVEPNGLVCADAAGAATGILLEHAAYHAWNAAPPPAPAERLAHVRAALRRLADLGYVEVHDMLSQPWLGPMLRELEAVGQLPVQTVWLYPAIDAFDPSPQAWESPRIRLAGAKLFADGTLNSRTALMLSDYLDPLPLHPRGQAMVSPAQLDAALRTVSDAPSPADPGAARGHLAVHAIGDGAVRMVLDAVERVNPRPDALGLTVRIEHAELIDAADVPRIARLGVVASVQPCHLLYDVEALTRYLPHRVGRVLPLRELIDAGCEAGMLSADQRRRRRSAGSPAAPAEIWFGSDVPIVRADPEDSVDAATLRRRPGADGPPLNPDQALPADLAWRCFAAR